MTIILIIDTQAAEVLDGILFTKTVKILQVKYKSQNVTSTIARDLFLQENMKTLIRKTSFDPEDDELLKDILLAMEHLDEAVMEIVETEEKADGLNISPKTSFGHVFMPNCCDIRFAILMLTFALAQSMFILTLMTW